MSKLDPHGLQQLLLGKWICSSKLENLPGLSLARWEACHVFSFTRPKETYFVGVRVKEEMGEGKRSFLLSLSSPPYPSPTPPTLTCSNASTSSELNTVATLEETLEAHVGKCSYRNFCRAVSRPNRMPLRLRWCDTHLIEAIQLVSTESNK